MDTVLTHNIPSIHKFGLSDDYLNDENDEVIKPFHEYDHNLDDLENVQGFNRDGKKNGIYGFKLNNHGIYQRQEIKIPEFFKTEGISPNVLYNIVLTKTGKLKLIKSKHDWDINVRMTNDVIST